MVASTRKEKMSMFARVRIYFAWRKARREWYDLTGEWNQ